MLLIVQNTRESVWKSTKCSWRWCFSIFMAQTAGAYEWERVTTFGQTVPHSYGQRQSNPYDYCIFGKHHRVSFQKNSNQKLEKLELMYSNVCESMEIDSLGGNKYFVSFIDDVSWKMWVYLKCTKKNQVFQYFQQFHAIIERGEKSTKASSNR